MSIALTVILQPKDSFSLINDPRNAYSKLYTVDKLGNIWGGRPVKCELLSVPLSHSNEPADVNTEIENMKAAVVKASWTLTNVDLYLTTFR